MCALPNLSLQAASCTPSPAFLLSFLAATETQTWVFHVVILHERIAWTLEDDMLFAFMLCMSHPAEQLVCHNLLFELQFSMCAGRLQAELAARDKQSAAAVSALACKVCCSS